MLARRGYGLSEVALPWMRRLSKEFGQTVLLTRRDSAAVARVDLGMGAVVVVEEDAGAVNADVGCAESGRDLERDYSAEGLDYGIALGAFEEAEDGVEDLGEAEVRSGRADGDEGLGEGWGGEKAG